MNSWINADVFVDELRPTGMMTAIAAPTRMITNEVIFVING